MSIYQTYSSQDYFNNSILDPDDPRRPLLGDVSPSRYRRWARELCGGAAWRRRLPITIWLPKYKAEYFLRDSVAGITVGLTSIPQGIAYALVAGLPPQAGLYASIFPGYVYVLLGSCNEVTVGPTAILAALLAKYVAVSADLAYLAAFLSGCVILLLGVLQLGCLLDFISKPVISGFTTAAALQIGASQLKPLFRIAGESGGTFVSAMVNFCSNVATAQPGDSALGASCVLVLVLLKWVCGRGARWAAALRARNALVVGGAALLAYALQRRGIEPFALTGAFAGGLPRFGPPPFSTVTAHNETLQFGDMLAALGWEALTIPLVTVLETIAIAKAFAGGSSVDATQEMSAVGACNVAAACCGAMPAAGSFTRTALNRACGAATPAAAAYKASLVLVAVWAAAGVFAWIPRAALAAVIVVAMAALVDLRLVAALCRNSKVEAAVWAGVVAVGAGVSLEAGIAAGAAADLARVAARAARPRLRAARAKIGGKDVVVVSLAGELLFASAEHVARRLRRHVAERAPHVLVLDAAPLAAIDVGVAESLLNVIAELEGRGLKLLLWNFSERHRRLLAALRPAAPPRCVCGPSIDQHVLDLTDEELIQRTN